MHKCSCLACGVYLFLTAHITLLGRQPNPERIIHLQLFWSYLAGSRELITENILNIIMFIPLGIFLYDLPKKPLSLRKALIIAALASLSIELIQLAGKLGEFEFDDILHNTAGALAGYLISKWLCRKLHVCQKDFN